MISQRTYTGRRLDLEAPTQDMICLDDIVQGLSHCCRFAGQVRDFYSVAQHSVLVSLLVDQPFKWAALNHDDTEAYMGDLSRHLKHHFQLEGYRVLEKQLAGVIEVALNCEMNAHCKKQVKAADDLAAVFEHWLFRRRQPWHTEIAVSWALAEGFIRGNPFDIKRLAPRLPEQYMPMPPDMARHSFLDQVRRLQP